MGNFKAISLSHKSTPIEIRELFSLNEESCKRLLLSLKERFDIEEALIVSTCNRTEVYYSFEIDINGQLVDHLVHNTEIGSQGDLKDYFVKIDNNKDTIKYLFEVSAGLHSQVTGDLQIAGQVKDAYQWSADLNMAGPILHRLMHTIFYANKRITQETNFRDGAASISFAATELVEDITNSNKKTNILLVGTGEIGRDVAKNLISNGFENFTVSNRTMDHAVQFSLTLPNPSSIAILPFENIESSFEDFDVVISAVQVEKPIITLQSLSKTKIFSHKYFLDLSIPRGISPEIESVPGVILYNLEDLNKKTTEAQALRHRAIPKVNAIIEESYTGFLDWSKEMDISPVIHKMKNALETIRAEEMARHQRQLNESEWKMVDNITKNMMQKVLKLPVVQLKAACKRGEEESIAEMLNELFDLEKQQEAKA